ncbi:outer membrane protein TolC [Dyadobacter jejuensis]|uniref:Outer membrane protein TolC n=1 Tax=Dyadobacter jejuensis TaxID=1082580 RepID=A0A316ANJ7_9BACT|nr:TolC family protein [Dyadobacter jejuensis]PWJ59061.1 outer membrane protein TolC [Dyadobacter jejuensis]
MNNKVLIRWSYVFAILFFANTESLQAQPTLHLNMADAIEMSLQNSKELKLSQSMVEMAKLDTRELKDNQLPSFGVTGAYLRLNTPNVNFKLGQLANDSTGSTSGLKVHQAAYGMATASVPVFSGFRFKYGIESKKYLEEATKLDVKKDREAVIMNTVTAYANLHKAQKAVDLVSENLLSEKDRVRKFTDRERNGLVARNDLMKVELQASNVELALLDAQNDLKVTMVNMNLMLGLPVGTVLETDARFFEALPEVSQMDQWLDDALASRKDLAANAMRQKATNLGMKVARADLYPSIALTAGYVAIGIPGVVNIPNAMNIGVGVNYNIASLWKSSTKISQAHTQAYQVKAQEGILQDQIQREVTSAFYQYQLSKQKIEVYTKAREQANENLRITKNKYENSLVTTTELLDADVAQVQAEINYEMAKADALVSYKRLQQVSGVIQ